MRILVVEDDQLLNKTLSYNLSAVGYSVDGAMSKAVAIRFLEKQDYDLIVLDVNLPDGNGFDICREVKERRPDTAVIFLTANDMESDMLKGFELGADDYVTKPFPISVFQKKVSALLNRISAQSGGDFYDDGNLYINFSELSACLAGQPITLTSLEYRLLKVLTIIIQKDCRQARYVLIHWQRCQYCIIWKLNCIQFSSEQFDHRWITV
jgi:two-component system OmpR family response regulator